jgi:hypothetical protein
MSFGSARGYSVVGRTRSRREFARAETLIRLGYGEVWEERT